MAFRANKAPSKYYSTTDKQATMMLDQEARLISNGSSTSKTEVFDKNPSDDEVHRVSSLVLYKDENSGDYKMQLEMFEQPKNRNGQYATYDDGKGNQLPYYNRYTISQDQMESYAAISPENSKRMYDVINNYAKNGDINVRFGPDLHPYKWSQIETEGFSEANRQNQDGKSIKEFMDEQRDAIEKVHEASKAEYFKEHEPIRIAYTATRYPIKDPVRVRTDAEEAASLDTNSWDLDAIYKATGIAPHIHHGALTKYDDNTYVKDTVDKNPVEPPFDDNLKNGARNGDHYVYTEGYKITPVLALDQMPASAGKDDKISNPYLVNYKGRLVDQFGNYEQTAKIHHELLIDPSYMTKLLESSKFEMSEDGRSIRGVVETTVYDHDHYYVPNELTDENNHSINIRNIRGQYTEAALDEVHRPAVPIEKLAGKDYQKPPTGCTRTLNIAQALPQGDDAMLDGKKMEVTRVPDKPFTDESQKIHNQHMKIAMESINADKQNHNQNAINAVMQKGEAAVDKADKQAQFGED